MSRGRWLTVRLVMVVLGSRIQTNMQPRNAAAFSVEPKESLRGSEEGVSKLWSGKLVRPGGAETTR